MDESEVEHHRTTRSQFDDETPATKPTRTIPEDADKGLLSFIDMIDGVYEIVHDPELLGNVIKSIMIELQSQPQYIQQVADEDIHVWVRAMRNTMGMARIKKTEAKAKRATNKAEKASGGKAGAKTLDLDMAALGISFD